MFQQMDWEEISAYVALAAFVAGVITLNWKVLRDRAKKSPAQRALDDAEAKKFENEW